MAIAQIRRYLLLCLVLLFAITGCGQKKSTRTTNGKIEIEVAVFQGGYGLDFFEKAAREYEKLHPNIKIRVWGNPRIWEQLRTRFVAGDVPDLCWPGWGMDTWALVYDGKVMEMDKYLNQKAYDQDIKWKDTFLPDLLDKGKYKGHYYILPFNNNVFGWWYNVGLFKKHGWKPPKTYEELLKLCEQIKKTGIAPITYQGKYPAYMIRGFLIPWAISAGGLQAFEDAQKLKPGAWKSAAFLKAARMIAELRDKGYFQKGAMGMDHTGAQMEFLLGRAAMIPCGTWLRSEMQKQIPPGFRMAYFNPPVLANGKGDPSITQSSAETWIVPKDAKHPEIGADFFRFMTSLKMAKKFVQEKQTLMSIKGSDQTQLPPDLILPARYLRNAKATWDAEFSDWYKAMNKEIEAAVAALLSGEISPEECCERMERAAEETRNDPSIPKH